MANKTPRLGPTGIDKYIEKVWNFYSGCKHQEEGKCPPITCWAETFIKRMSKKNPSPYPNGFTPTFYPEAFLSPLGARKNPLRIGVCFMGDLFGDWVDPNKKITDFMRLPFVGYETIKDHIKYVIKKCPQHTFVFLTKNPRGMIPWSPFPDNCDVGFSAWDVDSFIANMRGMFWNDIKAKIYWCSMEPLLGWREDFSTDIWRLLDWVALGALTGTKQKILEMAPRYPELTPFQINKGYWGLMPPVAWLKNIIQQCDAAGTKVWLKDNLWKWLMTNAANEEIFWKEPMRSKLRQEFGARLPVLPEPVEGSINYEALKRDEKTREFIQTHDRIDREIAESFGVAPSIIGDREFYKEPEVQTEEEE